MNEMIGMILLNFIKDNVDPTMPDKVQSLFSLDKQTIVPYAIGLFKLQSVSSNHEYQQEENHEETVYETAHKTADSDDEEYTLPFKVLGSVHHKEMQDSLEQGAWP